MIYDKFDEKNLIWWTLIHSTKCFQWKFNYINWIAQKKLQKTLFGEATTLQENSIKIIFIANLRFISSETLKEKMSGRKRSSERKAENGKVKDNKRKEEILWFM